MILRARPTPMLLGRLLLVALALGACATGALDGEGDDAAVGGGDSGDPPVDVVTFDLVSPLDDAGEADAGAAPPDVGAPDGGVALDVPAAADAGAADVGVRDVGVVDLGVVDAGVRDAGALDVGVVDAGVQDAGGDAGRCGAGETLCGASCVDLQRDAANCGRCGAVCGAGAACSAGACAAAACMRTASDCNASAADGCEVVHATALNACPSPEDLGAYCGDTACGFLCPSLSLRTVATRTGNRSRWYRVRLNECSNCIARLDGRVTLRVPAGVDYDLFVYSACGRLVGSSQALAGVTDQYTLSGGGSLGSDSGDFYIEVRWLSGASCLPYTLTVEARSNSASSC